MPTQLRLWLQPSKILVEWLLAEANNRGRMNHLCCEAGQSIDKGYGEVILQVIAIALKALVGQRSVQPTPKTIKITVQKIEEGRHHRAFEKCCEMLKRF
jgi:hypothetical protein